MNHIETLVVIRLSPCCRCVYVVRPPDSASEAASAPHGCVADSGPQDCVAESGPHVCVADMRPQANSR